MICNSEELKSAKKYSLYILGRKDYSTKDIFGKLSQKFGYEIGTEVVEWLTELDYLNDFRYGERLCSHLFKNKNYGRKLIAFELKSHGLSIEDIEKILSEYYYEDYIERILHFLKKKYDGLSDDKEIRRATNALIRRGHEYSHILECVNNVKEKP